MDRWFARGSVFLGLLLVFSVASPAEPRTADAKVFAWNRSLSTCPIPRATATTGAGRLWPVCFLSTAGLVCWAQSSWPETSDRSCGAPTHVDVRPRVNDE